MAGRVGIRFSLPVFVTLRSSRTRNRERVEDRVLSDQPCVQALNAVLPSLCPYMM